MTYCIELNMATVIFLVFVLGFWLGCIFIRYLNKPKKPAKPIGYDGTNGKGYQPLANQGQRPQPPQSEMPPLKKPKKGSCVSDWNGPVPQSRKAPPKPMHNPHK